MNPYDYVKPGDVVIDIGANVGDTVRHYAERVGPTGFVLAVEPHPVSAETLRARFADRPWVQVREAAVGTAQGYQMLYDDAQDSRRASLWESNVLKPSEQAYPVPMATLDELAAACPRVPALIKMDAQGAEAEILASGPETLREQPIVFLELWREGLSNAGATVADVLGPLEYSGYTPHLAGVGPSTWPAVAATAARTSGHGAIDVLCLPPGVPYGPS